MVGIFPKTMQRVKTALRHFPRNTSIGTMAIIFKTDHFQDKCFKISAAANVDQDTPTMFNRLHSGLSAMAVAPAAPVLSLPAHLLRLCPRSD
jgi:hypothetical protein